MDVSRRFSLVVCEVFLVFLRFFKVFHVFERSSPIVGVTVSRCFHVISSLSSNELAFLACQLHCLSGVRMAELVIVTSSIRNVSIECIFREIYKPLLIT